MMSNNKILTVSYGTFSCTLEGFDDSFGTMKAIAEYFRDLSADDRYFGSEPVQPDAQMLARIAEREISRHVEAREDRGRIVLSAQSTPKAAAMVAQTALDDVADAVADATVAKAKQADAAQSAEDAPADTVEPEADVSASPDQAAPEEPTAEADTAATEPAGDEAAQDAESEEEALSPETDIVPTLPDTQVEAFFAERPVTKHEMEDIEDIEPAPAQDRAKADSIAEKLKRIRAVVSQQAEAAQTPDYSEDQHADAAVALTTDTDESFTQIEEITPEADRSDVLADTLRDLEDALDADDVNEDTASEGESEEGEEEDIAAILNRLENEAEPEDAPAARDDVAPQEEEDTAVQEDADDHEMDENILAAMDTVEAVADQDDLDDDNLFEDTNSEEPEASTTAPAEPPAPRTRVLKVKRAALEAAIQSGQLEEYEDEDEDKAEAATAISVRKAPLADSSSLTDEDEEELARELAELEADMRAGDAAAADREETSAADAPEMTEDTLDASDDYDAQEESTDDAELDEDETVAEDEAQITDAARSEITGSTDKDFSRLMEESNNQMDEPEAATRRDAFAHLRAAVAAKKADEAAGGATDDEETDEAYRDDLASVVRPRRPISGTDRPRTERPAESRPAPLKLVAEQRIDVDRSLNSAPVRPRRVSAVPDVATNLPVGASSFTEFASDMGATKLPDLLEAAAAYLSFVEGHEEFSRPQLMTKVRQVEKDNFTREDSLRSFGKLLREGKIEKLKGGRFQASEQIGFKPDARAAG
jgi:hypothetical protein